MPKFYKRGALGRLVEAEDAYDPAIAEVWMPVQEYRDFKKEIRDAKAKADHAERRMRNILQGNRTQDEEKIKKLEAEVQKKISEENAIVEQQKSLIADLENRVKRAEADAADAIGLNQNLIRIMKERANQERGIRPKKQHEGYLVLECRQWTEKYVEEVWDHPDHKAKYDNDEYRALAKKKRYLMLDHKAANVWKSVIQTPFDASIPLEYIREEARRPLFLLIQTLGITHTSSVMGKYFPFDDGDSKEKRNTMYRIRFNANYREGFWEAEIFTTKALVVPEQMRPPRRAEKNRGASA